MFVWTFLLRITHTIISQSSADSSWITLYIYIYNQWASSSVSITTDYGLDGPGIESRWGEIFRHPDRLWDHPASCTMGSGSFPGVESGGDVTLTPHSLLVPRSKKQSRAISLPCHGLSWPNKSVKPTYIYIYIYIYHHWIGVIVVTCSFV